MFQISTMSSSTAEVSEVGEKSQTLLLGDDLVVVSSWVEPNNPEVTYSGHPNEEALLVISGELEVNIDGVRLRLSGGSAMLIPRGASHSVVNIGSSEAHYVAVMVGSTLAAMPNEVQEMIRQWFRPNRIQ